MPKIIFTLVFILSCNFLFAQYIHYSDKRNINKAAPASNSMQAPVQASPITKDTVIITLRDTVKQVVRDTVKIIVKDTVRIRDTVIIRDTVRLPADTIIYHEWPDKCPGLSGATPVLTNYVPKEMVLKLTEIYKGYLYSISSIKVANNKLEYKLKVCEKGEVKFEYADEHGDIIKSNGPKIER